MAYILKADGTRVEGVKGEGPKGKFTLEQLQKAVGGFIQAIPGTRNRAYFDGEGRYKNSATLNREATLQFNMLVVGDVIVLEKGDRQ